jgi:pimaricinolide synthase loading module/candicidin polyketide synthase FscA
VSGDTTLTTLQDHLITLIKAGTIIRSANRSVPTVLDTIQTYLPNYCVMAPATLSAVVSDLKRAARSLEKIGVLRVTGAYCPPALQDDAIEFVADQLMTSYGATEIGRVARGFSSDLRRIPGCVGHIVGGVQVAAFDERGKPLPPGGEGEIRVKVPEAAVATYPGKNSPRTQTFAGAWFRTGDIGLVTPEGELVVHGRSSNVINAGGTKISAELLEETIGRLSAVNDIGVVGTEGSDGIHKICAAIVSDQALGLDDINGQLMARNSQVPIHFVKIVPALPRTESGKIDRQALRQLFQ